MRGSRRLRQLERQYQGRREHAQRSAELEAENALEERRVREDPLGFDRYLDAMTHLFTVIEEEEKRTGWRVTDQHRDAPEAALEAERAFWQVRDEWLYGDTTSERDGPLNLSMRGDIDGKT